MFAIWLTVQCLKQSVTLSGLKKANKKFQPNLGSGQTSQIDLDFNRGKRPVIKSLSGYFDSY